MGATCVDWQDESRYFSNKEKGKKCLAWFWFDMDFKRKSEHNRTKRVFGHLVEVAVWTLLKGAVKVRAAYFKAKQLAYSTRDTSPEKIPFLSPVLMRKIVSPPTIIQTLLSQDATQTHCLHMQLN